MDWFALFINSYKCYLCDQRGDLICKRCFSKLERVGYKEFLGNKKLYSFYKYNQTASKILLMAKYPPYYFHILKYLIKLTYFDEFSKNTVLCPIPLSSIKMYERKFNQAELIAEEISKKQKLPVLDLLKRVKDTKPLFDLNKDRRKHELHQAFKVSFVGKIFPKKDTLKIVLVDDLVTTGETTTQCFSALEGAGFLDLEVVSLFRA